MWKVDYPTGTDTVVTYDNWDRPLSMVDGSGTSSWTFNAADELTTFASPQGTVNYEYCDDDGGKLKKVIEPGIGETLHEYDLLNGLLKKVTNPHGEITEHGYDAGLRPAWTKFGSGAREEFGYDDRGRMDEVVLKSDAQAVPRSVGYQFDPAGRMTSSLVDGVSTDFVHDAIGQLTLETRTGYAASYTYDSNGNRLTRTAGGVTETYATNARDELVSVLVDGVPVREYTVDLAGRTTAVTTGAGTTSFTYDLEDRVTSASYPGSGSSTYGYNGLDTRVSASGSFGSRTYRRAGAGVTAPVLGDGASHFTPGLSVRTGSETRFQHFGLKNIDAQSTSSQTISASRTYDAYGQTVASSGSWSGPFGYGGAFGYQSEPDSGLQLLGHRYYDPSAGRFLSRDKARDGGNWYAYCGNSPLTNADPTGPIVHFILKKLAGILKDILIDLAWDHVAKLIGKQHGARIHKVLGDFVKDIAKQLGIEDYVHVEQAYRGAVPYEGWRPKGTISADVAIGPKNAPWIVVDWKTGKKGMTRRQINDIERACIQR
ncbi:MAG: hypothetical protein HONBIEJF_02869 [Fimbriimonadaceae bacterium]|nr:hypothetical protein [Fimbriimonadaceae bacterium]